MKCNVRYTMQHIGDIVVDALIKASDSARRCAHGVVLTYDIHEIRRMKRHVLKEIGERVVQVTNEGLTDIRNDDKLAELFSELNNIEKMIETSEKERDEIINPIRARLKPSENVS